MSDKTTTFEQTAKPLKLLNVIGLTVMFVFCVLGILFYLAEIRSLAIVAWVLFFVGFALRIYAKTLIWWRHE